MRNFAPKLLAAAALSAGLISPASAFLENWYFNPSGTGLGGATQVNQYLDFIGTSYVQNYSDAAMTTPLAPLSPLGTNFFFKDNGAFNVLSHDSSGLLPIVTTGGEVTSLYSGGTGAGILGGGLTFNAGGTLAFFSQAVANFGSTTGIYGANDGTPIGSFTQISGCQDCFVNPTGLPTGAFAIFFEADTLAPGYWFNPDGSPMAAGSVLGFATFNGTYTTNPTANQTNEIAQQLAGAGAAYTNIAPTDFILGNNGQYRLSEIPEPSVMALFGAALVGLGIGARRRGARKS